MAKRKTKDEQTAMDVARDLYMQYAPVTQIAQHVGIPRTTLNYHINRSWKTERELVAVELFETLSDSKRSDFVKITRDSVKVMQRALSYLAERSVPPTVDEAKKAASILESLSKMGSKSGQEELLEQFANSEQSLIDVKTNEADKLPNNPFGE